MKPLSKAAKPPIALPRQEWRQRRKEMQDFLPVKGILQRNDKEKSSFWLTYLSLSSSDFTQLITATDPCSLELTKNVSKLQAPQCSEQLYSKNLHDKKSAFSYLENKQVIKCFILLWKPAGFHKACKLWLVKSDFWYRNMYPNSWRSSNKMFKEL